ncbi:MAG: radical SAM protein [Euryarchaeota archaeon]|nr:radical SAM protein [Euryarchaeota archaeon]
MKIRVSYGSAIKLGLLKKRIDCLPTTTYLMTCGSCTGRCLFCAQANGSESERLSRIIWPKFTLEDVTERIGDERVCIQCLNYKGLFEDVLSIVERMDNKISVSAQPFSRGQLKKLAESVDRVGISIDCASESLFRRIKPTYSWKKHWKRLEEAVDIFGEFKVTSHLIVGLGETEEEMVKVMQRLHEKKVTPSLFAFTPLKGTPLEHRQKPSLPRYRKLQLAYHLITEEISNDFRFNEGKITSFGVKIEDYIKDPVIYTTRGCPGCNRPYYNESPGGVIYNYPYTPEEEMEDILKLWHLNL